MSGGDRALHYVCTRDEAKDLIDSHSSYWVCNCGCREARGACQRSRTDVCLEFKATTAASGSGRKEVSRDHVEAILSEAAAKHLVTRPFRDEATLTETDGICFCCDDCCGYFIDPGGYTCDKGRLVESTDRGKCTDCGECARVCYFGARKMVGDELVIRSGECHGCGLCTDVCPEDCIEMVERC